MTFGGRFADSLVVEQLDKLSVSFLVNDLEIRRGGVAANMCFGLGRLGDLLPTAQALARRHVGYGVRAAHYDSVGMALLWTLEQGLGPAFTAELRTAWAAAYETLAGAMKQAAYDAD